MEGAKYDPKKIRFEVNSSPIKPRLSTGNNFTLDVLGAAEGAQAELLALYKATDNAEEQVLGKLNLISYEQISKNLVIVQVNKTTLPGGVNASILTQRLTAIYGQAMAG